MNDFWLIASAIFIYCFGFCVAAMIESASDGRPEDYSPWATPVPTLWPAALALIIIAIPFYLLGQYARWLARKDPTREDA